MFNFLFFNINKISYYLSYSSSSYIFFTSIQMQKKFCSAYFNRLIKFIFFLFFREFVLSFINIVTT